MRQQRDVLLTLTACCLALLQGKKGKKGKKGGKKGKVMQGGSTRTLLGLVGGWGVGGPGTLALVVDLSQ